MDFYEDLFASIDQMIDEKEYEDAKRLVDNELSLPYIPKAQEEKLRAYQEDLKRHLSRDFALSDEKIEEYLNSTAERQLIACDMLNRSNLRDYLDLVQKYLARKDAFINAQALLIDSLIRQEINEVFYCYRNDEKISFNPSFMSVTEDSASYKNARDLLREYYLKEPSKSLLAEQLLFKEFMIVLPLCFDTDEMMQIVNSIEKYVDDAFDSAN